MTSDTKRTGLRLSPTGVEDNAFFGRSQNCAFAARGDNDDC